MRLLIAEPDPRTGPLLQTILRSRGWVADLADELDEAMDLARRYDYDVIVTETDFPADSPHDHGRDTVRSWRRAGLDTPIIVVSSRAGVGDRVAALTAGADDFLPKPFHAEELVARLTAVTRRRAGYASSDIALSDNALKPAVLSLAGRGLRVGKSPVHLTGKEYALLELLALKRGRVMSKTQCLDHIYDGRDEPEAKIIDVFVCKLRAKLRPHGLDGLVETVWGQGYRLSPPAPTGRQAAA